MNVLIVYAHPNTKSFNAAVLESFTKGLDESGHNYEVVDLYNLNFDPSIKLEDFAQFKGGQMPQDVSSQQEKLAKADALVLISPIYGWFVSAILEGWIQRVFSWGFAWKASKEGMEGLLTQKKAIYICTTGNPEEFYKMTGYGDSMIKIMESSLKECGIKDVKTHLLYAISAVDDQIRKKYLDSVYSLGKNF